MRSGATKEERWAKLQLKISRQSVGLTVFNGFIEKGLVTTLAFRRSNALQSTVRLFDDREISSTKIATVTSLLNSSRVAPKGERSRVRVARMGDWTNPYGSEYVGGACRGFLTHDHFA